MAVHLIYRGQTAEKITSTVYKNAPLTNEEIDGNFKTLNDAIDDSLANTIIYSKKFAINAASAITLSPDFVSAFDITLTSASCTIFISDLLPVSFPAVRQFDMFITQGTGANLITWPANIRWQYNNAPVLSYVQGSTDMVTLLTKDDGATWLGFYAGGWPPLLELNQ